MWNPFRKKNLLIHYVNVDAVENVNLYLEDVQKKLGKVFGCYQYFIPIRNGVESRIEVIYLK